MGSTDLRHRPQGADTKGGGVGMFMEGDESLLHTGSRFRILWENPNTCIAALNQFSSAAFCLFGREKTN